MNNIKRVCQGCGSQLYGNPSKQFCTYYCKLKSQKKEEAVPPLMVGTCEVCKCEFKKKTRRQRFCCAECRNQSESEYTKGAWVIYSRDSFACIYCGKSSIEDGIKLNADHIVPKSRGGKDIAANLVTACKSCNQTKFNKLLDAGVQSRIEAVVAERNQSIGLGKNVEIKLGKTTEHYGPPALNEPSGVVEGGRLHHDG